MPAYQFTAIDASGKQQKGVLEGDSARQIRQQLRDKAWTPISVDPVEQKDKHQSQGLFQKKFRINWAVGMKTFFCTDSVQKPL